MKLNTSFVASQVDIARSPIIGEDIECRFSRENCQHIGTVRALTATTGEYTSAGGLGIPSGGRELFVRVASSNMVGGAGAMALTFNVTVDGGGTDTAVATFHLPTYTTEQANVFPIGIATDIVPVTDPTKKILTITGLASTANMVAGSKFEIFSSPPENSFVFIECCRDKGGMLNLPGIIEIACGRNPSAFVKLGRGESNPLKIGFVHRGAMEQLCRYNAHQGTIRFDVVKDDVVVTEKRLFSGFYVRTNGEMPDAGETLYTAEGPYTMFAIGYARVAA